MPTNVEEQMYSWDFVREIAGWSKTVTVAVTLLGGALTRDILFSITCALAAAIDIIMLLMIEERGRAHYEGRNAESTLTYGTLASLVGGRLAIKGILLGLAAALPNVLSFWGMVAGVLVVDSTVFLIGGPVATIRTLRARRDA